MLIRTQNIQHNMQRQILNNSQIIGKWVRKGDFYKKSRTIGIDREVSFYNYSTYLSAIKVIRIFVERSDSSQAYVVLTPSPSFKESFLEVDRKFFGNTGRFSNGDFEIKVDENFMSSLTDFIRHLNQLQNYPQPQIPSVILSEFESMKTFFGENSNQFDEIDRHYILEFKPSNTNINPTADDKEFTKLLHSYAYEDTLPNKIFIDIKKFTPECLKLLMSGVDIHRPSKSGVRALSLVVRRAREDRYEIAKLIMAYGGRFDFPDEDGAYPRTPFDYAVSRFDYKMISLFSSSITTLRKSLPPKKMKSFDIIQNRSEIVSIFRFDTSEFLHCTLKSAKDITPNELNELYDLYDNRFASTGEKNSQNAIFSDEKGKLITLIRDESRKIVGAVVYCIRIANNKVWVNIYLELFYQNKENYGMMPIITYSLPFSLQLLFPTMEIRILFFSASYFSYKRIESTLAYPKYQVPGMSEEIINILKKQFHEDCDFFIDPETCVYYVKEKNPDVVKGIKPTANIDSNEYLYEFFRSNNLHDQQGPISFDIITARNVLVSLPVAFGFLQILHNMSINKNINAFQIIYQLAKHLQFSSLMKNMDVSVNTQNLIPSFFESTHIFFNGTHKVMPQFAYKEFEQPRMKQLLKGRL